MYEKKILAEFKGNYAIFKNTETNELHVKNMKTQKVLKPYVRGWSKKPCVSLTKLGKSKHGNYILIDLWMNAYMNSGV